MSGSWLSYLQPASWRGVPFAVLSSEVASGRKTATHDYPFRDVVWIEDLGKKSRAISFRGFLVGDDCYTQEIAMINAAETSGTGELIHPSLGSLIVSLLEFTSGQDAERGRTVSLNFRFVQGSSSPLYPSVAVSTGDAVDTSADAGDTAVQGDFSGDVSTVLEEGDSVVQGAVQTIQGFASAVRTAVQDASLLQHAVAGLVPPAGTTFGRYAAGGLQALQPATVTLSAAIAAVTTAQATVDAAATGVVTLAAAL